MRGKLDHLPEKDGQLVELVLLEYAHVFHEQANDFKGTEVVEHRILLEDAADKETPIPGTLSIARKDENRWTKCCGKA